MTDLGTDIQPEPAPVELAIVSGVFQARPGAEAQVVAALARYVVMSRMQDGCRNIDLVASLTTPGKFLVYEKWESHEHQRAHMDSAVAVEMAETVTPLLPHPPDLDLHEPISAHDLL